MTAYCAVICNTHHTHTEINILTGGVGHYEILCIVPNTCHNLVERSLSSKAAGHHTAVKEILCIYRTHRFITIITPCLFHIKISEVVVSLQFLQQTFCTSCLQVQCHLLTIRPVLWLNLEDYLVNSHAVSLNLPNRESDVPSVKLYFFSPSLRLCRRSLKLEAMSNMS